MSCGTNLCIQNDTKFLSNGVINASNGVIMYMTFQQEKIFGLLSSYVFKIWCLYYSINLSIKHHSPYLLHVDI